MAEPIKTPDVKTTAPAPTKPVADAKVEAVKAPVKPAAKKTVARKPVAKKPVAKKPAAKPAAVKKAAPKVAAKPIAPKVEAPKVDTMEKPVETYNQMKDEFFNGYQEALNFNQGNVDAVAQSINTFTAGVTELTTLVFGFARTNLEDTVEASQAVMKCKNLKEASDLQASLAKSGYEKLVVEAGNVSSSTNKLAGDVVKPLSDRLNVAFESLSKLKKVA